MIREWVDRWLILTLLGLTSFGYYALGMTINEYLVQFSYTLGNEAATLACRAAASASNVRP